MQEIIKGGSLVQQRKADLHIHKMLLYPALPPMSARQLPLLAAAVESCPHEAALIGLFLIRCGLDYAV